MPPDLRDPAYLWDMLDASRSVREFAEGVTFEQYLADKMMRSAVERQLEILGEAARLVSEAFQKEHPEVPWRRIVGLRNVLAHDYGGVRHERVWEIISRHLPDLIRHLEPLVPPR
jgi:uncharacterized protein with HEPN domain